MFETRRSTTLSFLQQLLQSPHRRSPPYILSTTRVSPRSVTLATLQATIPARNGISPGGCVHHPAIRGHQQRRNRISHTEIPFRASHQYLLPNLCMCKTPRSTKRSSRRQIGHLVRRLNRPRPHTLYLNRGMRLSMLLQSVKSKDGMLCRGSTLWRATVGRVRTLRSAILSAMPDLHNSPQSEAAMFGVIRWPQAGGLPLAQNIHAPAAFPNHTGCLMRHPVLTRRPRILERRILRLQ